MKRTCVRSVLACCVLSACLLLTTTSAWAVTAGHLIIRLTDSRAASNVRVTVTATDAVTGITYSDWEDVSVTLPGSNSSRKSESIMTWAPTTSDILDENYTNSAYGLDYSNIWVVALADGTYYTNVRVTVQATINGYCHEDYEDLAAWSGDRNLNFNGNNASWDGSCFRGDMLVVVP